MADEGIGASLTAGLTPEEWQRALMATLSNPAPVPGNIPRVYIGGQPAEDTGAAAPPAAAVDWSKLNQPTGEVKSYTPPPSDRVQNYAQDVLTALGARPEVAGHLAEGLMGIVQATPLAVPLSAADTIYYKNQTPENVSASAS